MMSSTQHLRINLKFSSINDRRRKGAIKQNSRCARLLLTETLVVDLADQLSHCAAVDGFRKQVTLHVFAVHSGELEDLFAGLDAFGNNVHSKIAGKRENRLYDFGVLRKVDPRHK